MQMQMQIDYVFQQKETWYLTITLKNIPVIIWFTFFNSDD